MHKPLFEVNMSIIDKDMPIYINDPLIYDTILTVLCGCLQFDLKG